MSGRRPPKEKPLRSITPVTVAQMVYLTGMNYGRNALTSHARACSFGFLFSFIPIITMVAVVLIRILHASPDTVTKILAFAQEIGPYFDLKDVVDGLLTVKSITILEIIVGLFIFWITRGFFLSIFNGMNTIFHAKKRRQAFFTQLLIVIIEMVIINVIAAISFSLIIMQAIVQAPILSSIAEKLAPLLTFLSRYHIYSLPNALLFAVVTILYKIGAESKPSLRLCVISALLCNSTFWIFRQIAHAVVNFSNYNLIYGMLAKLMVTMLDVFIFFILFFIFAQFILIYQFFDEMLLGELYLLPKKDADKMSAVLRRTLFIRPDHLIAKDANMIHLKKGETVYQDNDEGTSAYYIVSGTVTENRPDSTKVHERGDFFGEVSCLLQGKRTGTAVCDSDTEIVRIDGEMFKTLVEQNSAVARKALGQISSYYNEVYGRTEDFTV